MGIRMIVKKAFRPGGSNTPMLEAGSPFEASGESLARTYRAMGWAEDAPPDVPAVVPFVPPYTPRARRDVVEDEAAPVAAKKTTRRYTRRDLTAE